MPLICSIILLRHSVLQCRHSVLYYLIASFSVAVIAGVVTVLGVLLILLTALFVFIVWHHFRRQCVCTGKHFNTNYDIPTYN